MGAPGLGPGDERSYDGPAMEPIIEDRAILVVDSRGDVAAALRNRIPPSRAYVIRRGPDEADAAAVRLLPFPFAVVGVTRDERPVLPPGLRGLLAAAPVLVVWQGAPPDDLPAHTVVVADVADCLDRVGALVDAEVAGVTLADYRGVDADGRQVRDCCALEAMVARPDGPWRLAAATADEVERSIADAQLPLRVQSRADGSLRIQASLLV